MYGFRLALIGVFFPLLAAAQLNLFNVVSSDITPKGGIFFDQQINIHKSLYQFSSTFGYGLGKNAEIGFNMFALNVCFDCDGSTVITNKDDSNPPTYPIFSINAQKAFELNEYFKLAIGTEVGGSLGNHFGHFTYLNFVSKLLKTHTKIITGLYVSSDSFVGTGDRNAIVPQAAVGFQVGIEQPLFDDAFSVFAENISGKHSLGEISVGVGYYIFSRVVLSCGYQFANPSSQAINNAVVDLTYVPPSMAHKKKVK